MKDTVEVRVRAFGEGGLVAIRYSYCPRVLGAPCVEADGKGTCEHLEDVGLDFRTVVCCVEAGAEGFVKGED